MRLEVTQLESRDCPSGLSEYVPTLQVVRDRVRLFAERAHTDINGIFAVYAGLHGSLDTMDRLELTRLYHAANVAGLKAQEGLVTKTLSEADRNHDGVLSLSEFVAFFV